MPVCDVIIVSIISQMLHAVMGPCYNIFKCLLVILSTLLLHLKAAKPLLETSQCTLRTQQR